MTAIEHTLLGLTLIGGALTLWRLHTDARRLRRIRAASNRRAAINRRADGARRTA